jgi:hypothetical protein
MSITVRPRECFKLETNQDHPEFTSPHRLTFWGASLFLVVARRSPRQTRIAIIAAIKLSRTAARRRIRLLLLSAVMIPT